MAILLILLAAGAAYACHGTPLFLPALAVLVSALWSNGVLANYSRAEADDAPNWAALLSMVSAVVSVGLIVGGILYSHGHNHTNSAPQEHPAQHSTPIMPNVSVRPVDTADLRVFVKPTRGLDSAFSMFATLATKQAKIIWTEHVSADKPLVVERLPKGSYIIALTASPCNGDCAIFHGGVTWNWKLHPQTVLDITPRCQLTKKAPSINCDGSSVKGK